MPETIAVIDLGSNTTRLNVYAIRQGQKPELLAEAKRKVRLSEDMGDGKVLINPAATARAMDAMAEFAKVLKSYPDATVLAVATEAMRRARNGPTLASLLEETTGIPIRIISGDEEAYFDFLAVRHTLDIEDALIIDTGGGSCELILMRNKNCLERVSLPIGSVVLSEKFTDKGDMNAAAIFRLFNHVHARLSQVNWLPTAKGLPVIALGGNHRAAGKIWKNNQDDDAPLHGYAISRESMNSLYIDLLDADSPRRQVMLGKNKDRADIISAGLSPLIQTIRLLESKMVYFCETGLRDGVLFDKLTSQNQEEP
jgi:exopolyphosphatase/guanosine-5'-triphosphate,3'-diphosphate pyrophosphatase